MAKVTFILNGKEETFEAEEGQTLLQIALDHGIPMDHACGGNGFCTTCLCNVRDGMDRLGERTDREDNMGIVDDPERLGCQTVVEGDVTVELEGE